jgi:Family of unknown function (DUF5684)
MTESDPSPITTIFAIAWFALILVAGWKAYAKAGQPGWLAVIPIVNIFGLLKIVHKPLWWFLLLFIPLVNVVVIILIMNALAKAFGRGVGFMLLLIFLTPIAYLILGFGSDRYQLQPDPLFG